MALVLEHFATVIPVSAKDFRVSRSVRYKILADWRLVPDLAISSTSDHREVHIAIQKKRNPVFPVSKAPSRTSLKTMCLYLRSVTNQEGFTPHPRRVRNIF
uniref:Uncharacterized protein n=1 Tax=Steinernema glaseri TaxID=37863 RepID=A0A1I7YML5_9BILA